MARPGRKPDLEKLKRKYLSDNMEDMLEEFFAGLTKKIKEGDTKAMKLFAEMSNFIKSPGVNIAVLQQNNSQEGKNRSFESIVRRIESREQGLISDDKIQDAEFEDVP